MQPDVVGFINTNKGQMNTLPIKNYLIIRITRLLSNRLLIRLILFIAVALWCTGILYNSLFPDSAFTIISSLLLKKMYGVVCHQRIEKTFLVNGHHFFVCARCTGIYAGALLISFLSLFSFPKLPGKVKFLYILSFPMLVDVLSTTLGIYSYSKFIAFITGLFFGSVVFVYILAALENNYVDKPL